MQNMIFRMRDKMSKFMVGRYGGDELTKFESMLLWIPILFSVFVKHPVVDIVCIMLSFSIIGHSYFRMFSRDISKRAAENQKFLNFRYRMVAKFSKMKDRSKQSKTYRFYKCPTCKQKVRVPKGHGKICITCPKCREEFVRHS